MRIRQYHNHFIRCFSLLILFGGASISKAQLEQGTKRLSINAEVAADENETRTGLLLGISDMLTGNLELAGEAGLGYDALLLRAGATCYLFPSSRIIPGVGISCGFPLYLTENYSSVLLGLTLALNARMTRGTWLNFAVGYEHESRNGRASSRTFDRAVVRVGIAKELWH